MKLVIHRGCFDTTMRIHQEEGKSINLNIDTKKLILRKILDTITDEDILSAMVQDYSYYLTPISSESNYCDQCGTTNEYDEFEI